MKKLVISVVTVMCMVVLMGGFAFSKISSKASEEEVSEKQENIIDEEIENKTIALTEEFIYSMYDEEYEKVSNMYEKESSKIFTADAMAEYGFLYFVKNDFIKIDKTYCDKFNDMYINEVYVDTKHKEYVFRLFYNKECEVLSFALLKATPKTEQSDYFSEELIQVGSLEDCKLDGVLTLPKGVEKAPVVILVHGSGYNDADESDNMK